MINQLFASVDLIANVNWHKSGKRAKSSQLTNQLPVVNRRKPLVNMASAQICTHTLTELTLLTQTRIFLAADFFFLQNPPKKTHSTWFRGEWAQTRFESRQWKMADALEGKHSLAAQQSPAPFKLLIEAFFTSASWAAVLRPLCTVGPLAPCDMFLFSVFLSATDLPFPPWQLFNFSA